MKDEWLKRFGRLVAGRRTKWLTLAIWIVVVGLLNGFLPQAGSWENNNAANLNLEKPSVKAGLVEEKEFPNETGIPALLVWNKENGLSDNDLSGIQALTESLTKVPLPDQVMVPPLYKLPPQALVSQISKDGSTLIFPVFFDKTADAEKLKEDVEKLKTRASEAVGSSPFEKAVREEGQLAARVTGPAGIMIDATALFKNADVSLLMATVLLVLVFLLLIYRSPILALIPLIAVGFAYGAVSPIIGWMAREGWITVDSQGISIMTVLLFGAGTDYCLFLVARYRQLLKLERKPGAAMIQAVAGTTGAIAMSGFTVVLSLFALLLAEFGSYNRFAVPFSLSILIMGIASLTLVPALLSIFGRISFFPFIPRTPEMLRERAERRGKPVPSLKENKRFGMTLGKLLTGKPWTVALSAIILLGIMASFAPHIQYTFDTLSSFPEDMPSREGFAVISDKFSPGELAPVKVIADTSGISVSLADALRKLDFVSAVSEPQKGGKNPNLTAYDVQLAMNPYSNKAMDRLGDLRDTVEKTLSAAGVDTAKEKVWISGQTAAQLDIRTTAYGDANRIIPVVLVLIAVLLLVYLRSVVAMVYLIATVLLSYFSALGLGWLVIHTFMGADAIQGFIPLYAFVFLVALGEDYNIFMVSSIWRKSRSMPLHRAVQEGAAETGSVITSAGLILAGTFAVLATLPIQVLVHFGVITAIGVLLDTFIVRPFLVPALTVILGRFAFWPGKARSTGEVEHSVL